MSCSSSLFGAGEGLSRDGSLESGEHGTPKPSTLDARECLSPFPRTFPFTRASKFVGAVLLVLSELPVSHDTDDLAEDREEKETVEPGGDWGGNGIRAGSIFADPKMGWLIGWMSRLVKG